MLQNRFKTSYGGCGILLGLESGGGCIQLEFNIG